MSDFIRLLNQIKTHRTEAWLTPSQAEAKAALCKSLRIPGTVNLFGSAGVGKTFLGWNLAEEAEYTYLPHVDRLADFQGAETKGLVVDSCPFSRAAHRDIRKHLSFKNIHRAVLITRRMIDDYTPYVELILDDRDLDKVIENLGSIGAFRDRASASNLWQLLNPYLLQLQGE